jgi:hypothetical protein
MKLPYARGPEIPFAMITLFQNPLLLNTISETILV